MKFLQLTDQAIDVSDWRRHEEFAQYPEGARDKTLLYSPSTVPHNFLKKDHKYLFKRSSSRYPEQFWVEIFASIVGNKMEIPVPPAFVAYDSNTNQSGALIEWFLNPILGFGEEIYIRGGDYCQRYIPTFDRKRGTQHNIETIIEIFNGLENLLWEDHLAKTLLFDALIGNTDRHQDNWAIIITPFQDDNTQPKQRISPIFDNGTSMGHEISSTNFKRFSDNNYLQRYVLKGHHHLKWHLNDPQPMPHIEMLTKIADAYPKTLPSMLESLRKITYKDFEEILENLVAFNVPLRLSRERADFMLKLITFRHQKLLNELEK